MLHLSGSKYTNEFITNEQVAADRAAFPFGKVPVLVVNRPDGTSFEFGESIAIEVRKTHWTSYFCDSLKWFPHSPNFLFGSLFPFTLDLALPRRKARLP